MFEQRIIDSDGDDTVIVGVYVGPHQIVEGGEVLLALADGEEWEAWRSRAAADIDPAVRLNLDYPEAIDTRSA